MSIITRMLKQVATYWPPLGTSDAFGQPQYGTAVQIGVRWEDATEQFLDDEGDIQMSKALVYVSQDVEVRGVLLLLPIASVTNLTDPKKNPLAWEIRRYERLPTFKATEFLRTALL